MVMILQMVARAATPSTPAADGRLSRAEECAARMATINSVVAPNMVDFSTVTTGAMFRVAATNEREAKMQLCMM